MEKLYETSFLSHYAIKSTWYDFFLNIVEILECETSLESSRRDGSNDVSLDNIASFIRGSAMIGFHSENWSHGAISRGFIS